MRLFDAYLTTVTEDLVAEFQSGDLHIQTSKVLDAKMPYETFVMHPDYNQGDGVVVEEYSTRKDAEAGHARWVDQLSAQMPEELTDVGTSPLRNALFGWDGSVVVRRETDDSPVPT